MSSPTKALDKGYIWDRLVRITHWIVALSVIFNFFSETGWWHRCMGYLAASLVVLRVLYGFPAIAKIVSASPAAHLTLPAWKQIVHHLQEICDGAVTPAHGHNPIGFLATYLMWLLILLLALSGWLAGTDHYWGEDWPVDLHVLLSHILEVVVLTHLFAIVLMSKLQKENLLKAMISGKKSQP